MIDYKGILRDYKFNRALGKLERAAMAYADARGGIAKAHKMTEYWANRSVAFSPYDHWNEYAQARNEHQKACETHAEYVKVGQQALRRLEICQSRYDKLHSDIYGRPPVPIWNNPETGVKECGESRSSTNVVRLNQGQPSSGTMK